ncbi:energy transducer TonB [Persicitalea jodogahamensis]|uniref:Cell envelope biogenesis protein TonB n=1 Tax=Persicitalea jodogahamensis TaxID=402147 RepID=A0A8J3GA05_9BACT|nr:energy transducer TonB [Persicitalea jodogahamensis]GHB68698.1 cell envelope biogenesis protein TonB [Persicitalea jodogahamensis]
MKRIILGLLTVTALTFCGCNTSNKDSDGISGSNREAEQSDYENIDEQVYTVVEEQPEYPGGMSAMYDFLGDNIVYTDEAKTKNVTGKVFVSFIVGSNGKIRDVKLLKGIGFGLDEEALRVVKAMPEWTPGRQSGEKVSVKYVLPVSFALKQRAISRQGL